MPAYKDEQRGTWYCSFYYTDFTGKKRLKKKRGFALKKDALEYERNFVSMESKSPDMKFGELSELYFEHMRHRLRGTTIQNKKFIFNDKILPYFKNRIVKEISSDDVMSWQNILLKQGFKPTYLKGINNQLVAILNFAVRHYNLDKNPCHIAGSMGKKDADEMKFWTVDEFNQFIKVVKDIRYNLAYSILFWTGIRRGELRAITFADILPSREIAINKRIAKIDGEDDIDSPKTPSGIRTIAIHESLYDNIINYTNRLYGLKANDLIFDIGDSAIGVRLKRYAKIAGVKPIRIQDFRHSHVALLIDMKQHPLLISRRIGHKKVETSLNKYGHLYPDKQAQLTRKFEDMNT